MQKLHTKLTQKYQSYNNWHQTKHHNTIHWGVLVVFTLLVFGTISYWTPISLAADTTAPTIPMGLIVTPISSSQINLSWTASTDDVGVTGYKIYRCAGSGCAPTVQIATSPINSYSDTGLTPSTAYAYAVSAYDAAGNESGKSGSVSATTLSSSLAWTTDPFGKKHVFSSSGAWQFPNIHPAHPRIFIKSSDLPILRSRIDTIPEITSAYNALKSWADKETTSSITALHRDSHPETLYKLSLIVIMEKQKGSDYSHYLNLAKTSMNKLAAEYALFSYRSDDAKSLATAYDWLFDELSASEKQTYVTGMIGAGTRLSGTGYMKHEPNPSDKKTQTGILFAGVAFYNDGINDQMARDIISYYGEWTEKVQSPLLNLLGGATGGTNKPINYFYDAAKAQQDFNEMWEVATGREMFFSNSYDKNYAYWDIYNLRPDNSHYRMYAATAADSSLFNGTAFSFSNYSLLSKKYNDGVAAYLASLSPKDWRYILWYDPAIFKQNYNTLPTTRLFDGSGDVFMKSGWGIGSAYKTPSDETAARFKSGNYYGGDDEYNQNDFEIYYKGSLALEHPSQGHAIDRETIKHNTILIDNEDQLYKNAGFYNPPPPTPDQILSVWGEDTANDLADIKIFETTSAYDYMLGDASKAYNPAKLSYFTREFVFLKPNYFVVFDRVTTTNALYSKKYLLHSINVPKIGDVVPPDGTNTYSNTDLIQIDRGGTAVNGYPGLNGRLFSKTLLPVNRNITVVGSGQTADLTNQKEFPRWRMEIEPSNPQLNDFFLNVMQTGDSNTLTANNTIRIDGDTMVGALINDPVTPRVVLFSKDQTGATVSSATYTASYPSSLTGKHLLTGITPGTYDIYKNGAKILTGIISQTGKNTLSFSSTGGSTFSITQTGEAPPVFQCSDQIDNDGDTKIDYPADPGCSSATDNDEANLSDIISPSTPTNLTATAVSSSQINLSWTASTDNVGVIGYKIYRCAGSACAPTVQIATSATNSYSNTGLTASTAYTYAVSAYDAAGNESAKSSSVSAATLAGFKPSDLNKDAKVDNLDFEIFKLDFNRTDKPVSDLNQDGIVDSRDLGIMMSEWTR